MEVDEGVVFQAGKVRAVDACYKRELTAVNGQGRGCGANDKAWVGTCRNGTLIFFV